MNKIISRMLVFGLLFSFVQAQEPSRDIDKEEGKNVSAQQKGKSVEKGSVSRIQDLDAEPSPGSADLKSAKKGGPGGKLVPGGGNSARLRSDDAAGTTVNATPKKAQRKGFFERLFGRGKSASNEPAIEPRPEVEGPPDDGDG